MNPISPGLQEVSTLIEQRKYADAINILKPLVNANQEAEILTLLGVAYFRSEQYAIAADAFQEALKTDPENTYSKEMLKKSLENSVSEIQVQVPDEYTFEREKLLSAPAVKPGSIPMDALPLNDKTDSLKSYRIKLGNGIGSVSTLLFESFVKAWGSIVGTSGEIWTNWYRRPLYLGIVTLAHMRNKLNKHNLCIQLILKMFL